MEGLFHELRQFVANEDLVHGHNLVTNNSNEYLFSVVSICMNAGCSIDIPLSLLINRVMAQKAVRTVESVEFLHTVLTPASTKGVLQLLKELKLVYTSWDYPFLTEKERILMELNRLPMASAHIHTIMYASIIHYCTYFINDGRYCAKKLLLYCRTALELLRKGDKALYERARKLVAAKNDEFYSTYLPELKHLCVN